MTVTTAKRRLYVLLGCIAGWGIVFLVVGFPVFCVYFKVPITTVASYAVICCVVQLAMVEWLFYARQKARSPDAWLFHRTAAVTVFTTTVSLLFFYYLRRGRPDAATREFTSIGIGVTLLFAVLLPVVSRFSRRMRRG